MKKSSFTMAEILISLTIIGIIAAITLPSLRANINEKTWATQRKALYSRMSQAISMLPSLNGYGVDPNNETNTANNAAQAFITNGLSTVIKINNICDSANLSKCGIVSKFSTANGTKRDFPTTLRTLRTILAGSSAYTNGDTINISYSLINTNAAAFETANGESVAVFYQPLCTDDVYLNSPGTTFSSGKSFYYFHPMMCANFIFDLNGKKGPNKVGKDIGFMTAFYPTDSHVVMPVPLDKNSPDEDGNVQAPYDKALRACRLVGSDVRLPNREELASMMINANLFNLAALITGTGNSLYYAATNNWRISSNALIWTNRLDWGGDVNGIRCIKR